MPLHARRCLLVLTAVAALAGCTSGEPPAAQDERVVGDPLPSITPVVDAAAVLQVEDQTSEGPTVLAKAAITRGGFIVVYGDDGRNELGSGQVDPGMAPQDVQVSLAEELTEPTPLLARLYADTDGNGLFSAPDQPVTDGRDDDSDDPEVFAGEQERFSFTGKPVVTS
jgi:hypothetical protein